MYIVNYVSRKKIFETSVGAWYFCKFIIQLYFGIKMAFRSAKLETQFIVLREGINSEGAQIEQWNFLVHTFSFQLSVVRNTN